MVVAIFLSEGIRKFLYLASSGPGFFEGMGVPNPEFWGNFVVVFGVVSGALLLAGFIPIRAVLAILIKRCWEMVDGINVL